MKELEGKRLLVLGGSLWKDAVKQFCSENGITLIAAGNDPGAAINAVADEYRNINSTDAEAMKKFIRENKVDGVYMGGNEPVIARACGYVNELGLPCYCTPDQWNALQDKKRFKELCRQFGLPVARELDPSQVKEEDYPVVTKPVDGCASKGFSVCRNARELENGIRLSAEASPSGRVIVEQYVPNNAVGVIYTVSEGRIIFSAIEDKYPVYFPQHGTYVGGLFDFESVFADEFRTLFEE